MTPRRYREHAPSAALGSFVSCFWSRAGGDKETRVLPDGAVDIIFDLGAISPCDSAYLVGTMTRPLVVAPAAGSDLIAVRFRPGGAHSLFGVSMSEFRDRRVPLRDPWPGASGWVERLWERRNTGARVRLLDELLASQLATFSSPEPRVASAVREIERRGGAIPVERLSHLLGVSRQHLGRLFDEHVGVGVKFFSRVVRLQRLLKRLQPPPPREALPHRGHDSEHHHTHWATLALDLGFYDQSHLVSEFKALTGLTPGRFSNNKHPNVGAGRPSARL